MGKEVREGLRDPNALTGRSCGWRRRWSRGEFGSLEAARAVRAIAERFALGLAATAQGDVFLVSGQGELVAQVVQDAELRG
jgi:hypothetical protein